MIIEDSPTQAHYLQYLLEQHGYIVSVAENARAGLNILAAHLPSLVISDVLMPEMDGFELCRSIKDDPRTKDVPVILLTSLSDPLDVLRGLECGADNFLTKPCEENRLLSRIADIFANRRNRDHAGSEFNVEVILEGKKRIIRSDPVRMLTFLYHSYETAIERNRDLTKVRDDLRQLSTHDTLTGLFNRAFFEEELQRLQLGRQFPVSVLVADVDDLKPVNDRLGHAAGDRQLRLAAGILSGAFRAGDVVARIGGDEFAVLLPGADELVVAEASQRIRTVLRELNASGDTRGLSISIGAATAHSGDELTRALKLSDERMYQEKFTRKRCLAKEDVSDEYEYEVSLPVLGIVSGPGPGQLQRQESEPPGKSQILKSSPEAFLVDYPSGKPG
ncbi:diguanylate cyclase domain-containing protein [Geomesophilobacter sediminis]|uniref:diguanylate cyclase n=1 Tax=Geomesophilobacter sediminis TaxID=2798584 RepID=A0A8J7M052_9BACT|nr:diguanylate cyclase [Geomesophilobacter sediminis]MBJ6723372.1 diguanylate cyclase [Geomesophilobacter sediminis]